MMMRSGFGEESVSRFESMCCTVLSGLDSMDQALSEVMHWKELLVEAQLPSIVVTKVRLMSA